MSAQTVSLTGLSGQNYLFSVYSPVTTKWNAVAGVYAFVIVDPRGNWRILYIGQTDSFLSRVPLHPQWAAAVKRGANYVFARVVQGGEDARRAEEKDLIGNYNPPLNQQQRTIPPSQPTPPPFSGPFGSSPFGRGPLGG